MKKFAAYVRVVIQLTVSFAMVLQQFPLRAFATEANGGGGSGAAVIDQLSLESSGESINCVEEWLVPLTIIFFIIVAVAFIIRGAEDDKLKEILRQIEYSIIEHYVLILAACMFVLPLLVQAIYSVPLLEPKISSEGILAFWGVLLGILGAAFSYQKQAENERVKRRNDLSPSFKIEMPPRNSQGNPYTLRIFNQKAQVYSIIGVCETKRSRRIEANGMLEMQLDASAFEAFNAKELEKYSKEAASKIPAKISIQLCDVDGTTWHVDYRYSLKENGWKVASRSYVDEPRFT